MTLCVSEAGPRGVREALLCLDERLDEPGTGRERSAPPTGRPGSQRVGGRGQADAVQSAGPTTRAAEAPPKVDKDKIKLGAKQSDLTFSLCSADLVQAHKPLSLQAPEIAGRARR